MATAKQARGKIERVLMATATQARGEIDRRVVYPLPVFMQRTGLGRKAVAKLRREGMPVRRAGRNSYIAGEDFHAALIRRTEATT